jgi:hypothetical protein
MIQPAVRLDGGSDSIEDRMLEVRATGNLKPPQIVLGGAQL